MRIFFPGTPDTLRRQLLKKRSTCAIEVHSLVRGGGAASGSVSSGVVSVSGAGGHERPTPPSTTETNQTPPGVGSGGEGVASLPSDPPPEETAETNQAPGGERAASSPSDPPPEETAETNQAPGGERVASSPSEPPPEETAETNQAPEGEAVVSLPSEPPPEETAETNQAPGGGVASPPSDPPAAESETNKTETPPTQGASDSFKEVSETCLRVGDPSLTCYYLSSGGDRSTKAPGRR